jgi:hypothetical protein
MRLSFSNLVRLRTHFNRPEEKEWCTKQVCLQAQVLKYLRPGTKILTAGGEGVVHQAGVSASTSTKILEAWY